jgi:16S rRNA (cytosine1407-C5)-methyltransferase
MSDRKSLPNVGILGRYRELIPEDELPALEDAVRRPPPTAVRFNPLKVDPRGMAEDFKQNRGWQLQPVSFYQDAYTLTASPEPPGRVLESRLGYFYIQDAASMLPVESFEPPDTGKSLILDLTAAPGGKSTHLAARFGDRGLLIANDGTASRIPGLSAVLKTWGVVNSAVTNIAGEKFGQWYPETFDLVLLDAPCSMENLHPGAGHKREIKAAERHRLAARQTQLLLSAIQTCKPGGQVVYSTCTLAPEEDEAVLDAVLRHAGKAIRLTDAGARLGIHAPGLTAAFGQGFSPDVAKSMRLWPHRLGTSGFFCAHLRKEFSLEEKTSTRISHPGVISRLEILPRKDQTELCNQLLNTYGLDLPRLLEEFDLLLKVFRRSVYALPRRLESDFPGLAVNSCGLRLGDYTESSFEISLEWATRFSGEIHLNRYSLNPEFARHWARGEDIPVETNLTGSKGTVLIITNRNDRVIGTGRISGRGIKNLLPRHLALKS